MAKKRETAFTTELLDELLQGRILGDSTFFVQP